jgi:ribosomal protein S27E
MLRGLLLPWKRVGVVRRVLPGVCIAMLAVPAAAHAAPPPNDNRGDAQAISRVPATVDGTTVDSTHEDNEPGSACGQADGSVWYRVTPAEKGRVILSMQANGALDAVVDVYRVTRSQLSEVSCELTDKNGQATLAIPTGGKATFLIRVSQLVGSASDTFRFTLQYAQPPAQPPGPALPRGGATGTLDRVLNPSAAYSMTMLEGVTYRVHLESGDACTPLAIYAPGTRSFSSRTPVRQLSCGGYALFTPRGGRSGLYTLLAKAGSQRGPIHYRLTGGRATQDDTTPGRRIANYSTVHGALAGSGIDIVDLYRFDVRNTSALLIGITSKGPVELALLRDTGHVLEVADGGEIRTQIPRGRYYLAVRATGPKTGTYTLTRLSRTVTRTGITANKGRSATVTPGQSVTLGVAIKPGTAGPVQIAIERFDPLEGWQFSRRYTLRTARGGRGTVSWTPPSEGRYRVAASFRGTRGFSPSASGYAKVRVLAPLRP